jgi:hypothetical protein
MSKDKTATERRNIPEAPSDPVLISIAAGNAAIYTSKSLVSALLFKTIMTDLKCRKFQAVPSFHSREEMQYQFS